jgi:hypothetical protein
MVKFGDHLFIKECNLLGAIFKKIIRTHLPPPPQPISRASL